VAALLAREAGQSISQVMGLEAGHENTLRCDVLIVVAGPAGLAAALELKRLGVADMQVSRFTLRAVAPQSP
jgi:NADPH-dependent 2,4-dienoyl-CoA reductase/sulfur reductase-like enzyme